MAKNLKKITISINHHICSIVHAENNLSKLKLNFAHFIGPILTLRGPAPFNCLYVYCRIRMAVLWILAVLATAVCGQTQDFDLSQFDFSGMNFNANPPPSNGPTQAPAGVAFSNQASVNNMPQQPLGAPQGTLSPMQNQPMLSNRQQQGTPMAFPTQVPAQNPLGQTNMQSSRVNSLTPEESWLTVGGSQMQNRNPALAGSVGNTMPRQPSFPNQNGFNPNGPQGFMNRGPAGSGFSNQGQGPPPNQGFDQFGTPGNDRFTFNVNAMGPGPSDFSAFNNNPFDGTPFGDGLNINPNQFGNPNNRNPNFGNPNNRNPNFGNPNPGNRNVNNFDGPQVSFIDAGSLPPSVQMAMNMNRRPLGGLMGSVPGGLPGLDGFTGFQPPLMGSPSRGRFGGFLSRSKFNIQSISL
jgi:hypothetical protein